MSDNNPVTAYVPDEQYERWEKQRQKSGMSKSEWLRTRVEAGLKKFSRDVQPDETRDELREKNSDLRGELKRTRDRVAELEEQRHVSEREAVLDHIGENPGAGYQDILQHLMNTAHTRVTKLLDQMEGSDIEIDNQGRIYRK